MSTGSASRSIARPPGGGRRVGVGHGIGVSFLCALFLAALQQLGIFGALDLRFYDLRYTIRGERPADDAIALVVVDDATMVAFENQPLPRDTYAVLLDVLEEAGARAIGFDLQFLGADPRGHPEDDRLLAEVTARHPNVVHAISFLVEEEPHASASTFGPREEAALRAQGAPADDLSLPTAREVTLPFPELMESGTALGHISVGVDDDGTIRRVPPVVRYGDRAYLALAIRLAGVASGDPGLPRLRKEGASLELKWRERRLRLPLDHEGCVAVDFAGDRSAFPRLYSVRDVLAWNRGDDWATLRETFAGRIVLIGSGAVAQVNTDLGPTPFARATPLLFVHANTLNAALSGRFLSRPPPGLYRAILVALAILLGGLFSVLSLGRAAAITALWLGIGVATDWMLFIRYGIVLAPTVWILLPPVAYVTIESYRLIFYERRTREQERELRLARSIQVRLLPDAAPDWNDLDVHGVNIPAREVGGDYYDWVPLDDGRLVLGLGDVSGKGVAAALLMSHLHASLHGCIGNGVPLNALARSMHLSLHRAIEPGRFATFFLASVDRAAPKLRYCNAGHNPAILVTRGGVEMLEATGIPMGIAEDAEYAEEERVFDHGDVLVLYSDGVTECFHHDELYGEERLRATVGALASRDASARGMIEGILDDIRRYSHGHIDSDDVTLLVVRRR